MRSILMSCVVVVLVACGGQPQQMQQQQPPELQPPNVPDLIKAPDTVKVVRKVFAKGTQNYGCQADTTAASGYAFKLIAPDATLYDGEDDTAPAIGKHYAGPTWEETSDGSKFVGDSPNAKKADSPDSSSIQWLLVPKKDASGTGEFSKFTFAQRVNTSGGKAPATGCDADHSTATINVPYTANYYFYEAK